MTTAVNCQFTRSDVWKGDTSLATALQDLLHEVLDDCSGREADWIVYLNRCLHALAQVNAGDPDYGDAGAAADQDAAWDALSLLWNRTPLPADPDRLTALILESPHRDPDAMAAALPGAWRGPAPATPADEAGLARVAAALSLAARGEAAIRQRAPFDEDLRDRWLDPGDLAAFLMHGLTAPRPEPSVTYGDALAHCGPDGLTDRLALQDAIYDDAMLHLGRPGECGGGCPAFAELPVPADALRRAPLDDAARLELVVAEDTV